MVEPMIVHDYSPGIRARLLKEVELIADAEQRGWVREVERRQNTKRRLYQLLPDLHETIEERPAECRREDVR